MYIDAKLNWKTHIDYIYKRVSTFIRIITQTQIFTKYKSLTYYIMLLSYLILAIVLLYIYIVDVWGNAYKSNINRIYYIILQNRSIGESNLIRTL